MSDHQWTVRGSSLGAIVEHPDRTSLRIVNSRVGETSDDVARRVAAALNGGPDLTALAEALAYYDEHGGLLEDAWRVVVAARALVASTATEGS